MMGTHKPYPAGFKQEAIRLVTEQGMAISQVARDLGIAAETLRRWVQAQTPTTPDADALASSAAELTRLRRENEQLRLEL
jgi:transposase